MHPRILVRMLQVQLDQTRDDLLSNIDQLIDRLDHLSELTGGFTNQADTLRKLRRQVAVANIGNHDGVFLNEVKQHMAELVADLLAFAQGDPPTQPE